MYLSNRNFQPGVGRLGVTTWAPTSTNVLAFLPLALQAGNRFHLKPDDELSKTGTN